MAPLMQTGILFWSLHDVLCTEFNDMFICSM